MKHVLLTSILLSLALAAPAQAVAQQVGIGPITGETIGDLGAFEDAFNPAYYDDPLQEYFDNRRREIRESVREAREPDLVFVLPSSGVAYVRYSACDQPPYKVVARQRGRRLSRRSFSRYHRTIYNNTRRTIVVHVWCW